MWAGTISIRKLSQITYSQGARALPTLLLSQGSPKVEGAVLRKPLLVLDSFDCVHPGGPS